jgi:hypothetical protein
MRLRLKTRRKIKSRLQTRVNNDGEGSRLERKEHVGAIRYGCKEDDVEHKYIA